MPQLSGVGSEQCEGSWNVSGKSKDSFVGRKEQALMSQKENKFILAVSLCPKPDYAG